MSYSCHYCNKRSLIGHNVSHANNKTVKLSMPNLQTVRVLIGKTVRRVRACTRCIRSGVVVKAACHSRESGNPVSSTSSGSPPSRG